MLAAERGAVGVFVAPQCAASRCPWMSALMVLVAHVSSCARGPLYLYDGFVRYTKNDDHHEPRSIFYTKYRMGYRILDEL